MADAEPLNILLGQICSEDVEIKEINISTITEEEGLLSAIDGSILLKIFSRIWEDGQVGIIALIELTTTAHTLQKIANGLQENSRQIIPVILPTPQ